LSATVTRGGTGHGLGVWFDCELCEGVGYSNAPGAGLPLIYGNAFFPWPTAVALDTGDVAKIRIRADLSGEDYVWSWDTVILGQGDRQRVKADFRQSTFFGEPNSPAKLRKIAAGFVPALSEDGAADQLAIGMMDGTHTLDDIARRLQANFPEQFPDFGSALTRAGKLSLKYSK
jgi:protein arginine N-methyltransferase 1